MEALEIEKEVEQIAQSDDYANLVCYVDESFNDLEKFHTHWWLARLAYARIRRRIKQKMRTTASVFERINFYRALHKRLPAFAKAVAIL